MGQIGTYEANIPLFTPSKALVEPGDAITWDLLDTIGQFSQRLMRCISTTIKLANNATCIFYYGSLSCDFHPPYLKAYWGTGESAGNPSYFVSWNEYVVSEQGISRVAVGNIGSYCEFREIGLGSAVFYNNTGSSRYWKLIAFL